MAVEIVVDSTEYKCWHEVGHATICLHLGGDVECIEFLEGHAVGHARARCIVLEEMEKSVACGGFAAEFYLLNNKYAAQAPDDTRNISQVVFHNAIADRAAFWNRPLEEEMKSTKAEDEKFMNHAINHVAPVFDQYVSQMREIVRELLDARSVSGKRIKNILRRR